jgi:hypothetical protein
MQERQDPAEERHDPEIEARQPMMLAAHTSCGKSHPLSVPSSKVTLYG